MQKFAYEASYALRWRRGLAKTILVMKLTLVLLTAALVSAHASGVSQQISFSGREVSLKEVFSAVEKQTGYVVFADRKDLKNAQPVSCSVKNMPLKQFLDMVLKEQSLSYTIDDKTIMLSHRSYAAALVDSILAAVAPVSTVTGTVTSAGGAPLSGATVTVKKTKTTAYTDEKGHFSIDAVAGDRLEISFVGYQTKEVALTPANIGSNISVQLSVQVKDLGETVVTAYGIEKSSREVGYSTAKVTGEELTRANSGNLLTGLTGRVSGLNIASQSPDMTPQMKILLRGIRSFSETSNNQPLFVLNGSILSFGSDQNSASLILDFINNINPNDIDKVTILKGANATALYGPEGVNGVILITTKKGQKGKAQINIRQVFSYQRVDFRPQQYRQNRFGTGTGQTDANGNGIYSSINNNGWGPIYDGSKKQLGRPDENGNVQMVDYADRDDYKHFYNTARTTQTYFSLSQGDATSDVYFSAGINDQRGLLPGDSRTSIGLLMSGGRKLNVLDLQYNINFNRTTSNVGPEGFGVMYPTFVPILNYKDYNNNEWADNNHYWVDQETMSPYQRIAIDRKNTMDNAVIASFSLSAHPFRWLTIRDNPQLVLQNQYFKQTVDAINYSDWAKKNGGFFRLTDKLATLSDNEQTITTISNNVLITAVNRAGVFSFRNAIGHEIKENTYKKVSGISNGLTVPVYNLAFSKELPNGAEQYLLSRNYSLFATSSIGYKDKVYLELTARNDWDSKRAKAGRGKDLYIGGNTSVLLQEIIPALKELHWLSNLQLKTALTTTANMNIQPFQAQRTLQLASALGFPYSNSANGLVGYTYLPGNPNPNLKPEKVLSFESGFSAAFWKNKVQLDFAYYTQRNNGVIMPVNNPWQSGAPTLDNLGVIQNYGWEADLRVNSIFETRSGFNVGGAIRLAYNQNEVKQLSPVYGGIFAILQPGQEGNFGLVARTGHQAFEYWLRDVKRDPQGRVIVNKTTGAPTLDNATAIYTGNSTPKYMGGVNFNLSWHQFTFTTLGECMLGAQHYFKSGEDFVKAGLHTLTMYNDRKPYVIPNSVYNDGAGHYIENKDAKVTPNSVFYASYGSASVNYLTSANFFRVREMALSYEQPFNTKTIKKLVVGLYGRNLFNFYAKDNIYGDPQLIKGPGRLAAGGLVSAASGAAVNKSTTASGSGSNQFTPSGLIEFGLTTTISF